MLRITLGGPGQDKIHADFTFDEAARLYAWLGRKLAQLNPDRVNPAHAALAVERSRDKGTQ